MRHPVSEGIIAHVAVAVAEHASAGQVREHGAGISGGHMQTEDSGRVNVLPMEHEQDSQRKNRGLHDPNLSAYRYFLRGRGPQNCSADHLCASACLPPAGPRKSQQEQKCPNSELHLPPPSVCWRRTWGWLGGSSMDGGLIGA